LFAWLSRNDDLGVSVVKIVVGHDLICEIPSFAIVTRTRRHRARISAQRRRVGDHVTRRRVDAPVSARYWSSPSVSGATISNVLVADGDDVSEPSNVSTKYLRCPRRAEGAVEVNAANFSLVVPLSGGEVQPTERAVPDL
jgi:hypothetical protein